MNIGIIGLGNLGTAIAQLATGNGHSVLGWEHDEAAIELINREHRNPRFLPGIPLSPQIQATHCVDDVLQQSELIFITLPSRHLVATLQQAAQNVSSTLAVVNMSKGIDRETGQTAYTTTSSLFPNNPTAMLAGPSLANEFSSGIFTGVVAASTDPALPVIISQVLGTERFVVTQSDDPIGVSLGGVLKNIYALGLGLFDGSSGYGLNFIGAFLTQAMKEMVQLGTTLGGKEATFWQLCGIGDLIATAMSEQSHNHTMGRLLGQGLSIEQVQQKFGVMPEGYNTLHVALKLAEQHQVAMPLAQLLLDTIDQQLPLDNFYRHFADILNRR